jgi:hypothetical protein
VAKSIERTGLDGNREKPYASNEKATSAASRQTTERQSLPSNKNNRTAFDAVPIDLFCCFPHPAASRREPGKKT